MEELISGVFGANVGGIKRDENAKISPPGPIFFFGGGEGKYVNRWSGNNVGWLVDQWRDASWNTRIFLATKNTDVV